MSNNPRHLYEFGPFRLDPAERLLLRDGEPVALTPKAFETLVVLVERSGRLVEKDELMDTLWPDSHVEEANLTNNVWALRKALGEGQTYIETVPKLGYRFTTSVKKLTDATEELVVEKHTLTRIVTEEGQTIIGNDPTQLSARGLLAAGDESHGWAGWRLHIAIGLLGLLVTATVVALYQRWSSQEAKKTEASVVGRGAPRSVAVLPFKTIGAVSSDNEYLGMGMSDALITKLGNTRQIIVRPTSAVRKYTDPKQDPVAVGRQQAVEAVLDGSVQRAGGRIRVTVQLIRVQDGVPLWTGKFDEYFTDIFRVQDSISERVVSALALQLSGEEKRQLAKHFTENAEAHKLYLMGRYFWNKRTSDGFTKAIKYFTEATEKDPNYAQAYVGLADSYQLMADYDLLPPVETQAKARAAVVRALEIDDTLAEAHASLADILKFYDWNWAGAEKEYRRAIQLNPNYATAHQWYAEYLAAMGRKEEAVVEITRAQELDPLSVVTHSASGWVHLFLGQYDRAIEECRKVIEMDPGYTEVYSQLRRAYEQKGMYAEALEADEKYRKSRGRTMQPAVQVKSSYPASAREYWQGRLEVAKRDAEKEVTTLRLAEIYAQLGEKDLAFEWLEKAFKAHSFWMPYLKVHPHLTPLHSDPRFADLLRRIGFAS